MGDVEDLGDLGDADCPWLRHGSEARGWQTLEASAVLATGYLRLDREEWIRSVEKCCAALGG
jgi:hypothetical protein